MINIVKGLFILLIASGFEQMAFASSAGDSSVPIPKDICWQKGTKQTFKDDVGELIDNANASARGHALSQDDVASSPRLIKAEGFGLISIDSGTGYVRCNASITVTYRTRSHGTLVVPKQVVNFGIEQTENGSEVDVKGPDLMNYAHAYANKLREITTDADRE